MVFVELPAFARRLPDLLDDDAYLALQLYLLARPDAGALIRGGGGLRKVRWAAKGMASGAVPVSSIFGRQWMGGFTSLISTPRTNAKTSLEAN